MRYSALTHRIAGDGAAAWNIHYRAVELQSQGREIFLLSIGDPDFDTPQPIVQAAIDSLRAGHTHYADVRGSQGLRQAIASHQTRHSGQPVDAQNVVVLAGAQCALYGVAQCLFDPGDEVIVAEPMYVTYEAVFGACGARVVPVAVKPEQGFRVDPADVAARVTPRTRALLFNSPHNPTGASLPRATWERLAQICIDHDLWLISDEVYSELLYEGEHFSPASLPGMAERTATINSLSKSHAMSGWRVGWVIGPQVLGEHLSNLALCMLYGLPDFIQNAAQLALEQDLPQVRQMRDTYRERRDRVCASLADCPGVRVHTPDGGMFVMIDIRETGMGAQAFAERLLEEHGVSVLAGDAFGPSAAGHLRLGLVLDSERLEQACRRIARCAMQALEGQASVEQGRRHVDGKAQYRGVEHKAYQ
ncbi:aminotransferase class I/II-fold pyridoxal phosphate-dependent enzyme [Pseudomonas sp. JQ170]|uniref:pyridoxal phosphate-dependent aminotransferase n=1 Tax=unclassified Pseudomonas TaxID=196821 RepID=UPI0026505E37|nr:MULTISPECIES: aminotransferase class I/II-fold pyridoxal phosphate-dependent enzyme [unclassified Pseudomonas]MDN7140095.1 aminotransferase class I/II-fold pyridoxal phosphate-dependent enzyme [Pseudomonas sp. JQ170]WRO78548.1 aminotransferase class I/II-fold pyridoxal phosphate-dependent enzyme [Pseudomonas sp. 170C]